MFRNLFIPAARKCVAKLWNSESKNDSPPMSSMRLWSLAANPYEDPVCAESTLLFLALLWDCTSSILSKHCLKQASNTFPNEDSSSTDLLGEQVAATHPPREALCAFGRCCLETEPRIALRLRPENRTAHSNLDYVLNSYNSGVFFFYVIWLGIWLFFPPNYRNSATVSKKTGHDFLITKVLKLHSVQEAFLF